MFEKFEVECPDCGKTLNLSSKEYDKQIVNESDEEADQYTFNCQYCSTRIRLFIQVVEDYL